MGGFGIGRRVDCGAQLSVQALAIRGLPNLTGPKVRACFVLSILERTSSARFAITRCCQEQR